MKKKRPLLLIGIVSLALFSLPVFAAEDNEQVITYDSLSQLIEESNYTLETINSSIDSSKQDIEDMLIQMKSKRTELKAEWRKAKQDDDTEVYIEAKTEDRMLGAAIKNYESILDSFDNNSSTRSIRQLTEQLTSTAQSMMISYRTLLNQRDMLADMAEIYERQYQLLTVQNSVGMVTVMDVSGAYANLLSANSILQTSEEGMLNLRDSLYLFLGCDESWEIDINSIPEADTNRIATMNPNTDLENAIKDNYSLISLRRESAKTTLEKYQKEQKIEEAERNLYLDLKSKYEKVEQANQEYQIVLIGFEAATLEMNLREQQYQLGMLSELEYLSSRLSYLQKVNEKDSAELTLFQAMESYDWAISGLGNTN